MREGDVIVKIYTRFPAHKESVRSKRADDSLLTEEMSFFATDHLLEMIYLPESGKELFAYRTSTSRGRLQVAADIPAMRHGLSETMMSVTTLMRYL